MSKDELIEKLQKIANSECDAESAHIDADHLLLEYINDEEVTKAFKAVPKWYS